MTNSTKLMRGVFLALALIVAPIASMAALTLTATSVEAQGRDPLVSSVLFEGNQGFSDAQLIAMVDVATRGIASPALIAADEESIRLAYADKGYTNVTVSSRVEETSAGRVRITFIVNEGNRAGIAAINFTGNNSIDAGTLKGVIRTRESHLLSWLFRDDTYTEQQLAIDKELIRIYYGNRGFPDAVVTSAVAEFDPGRNAYFVSFTVSEGDRYEFGNVSIETSIPGLNADALRGSIRTNTGSRYSISDLEKTQADMAFEATAQGYPFADVRPRINRDFTNKVLEVTYLVDEGPRVYVERIDITGNQKTRDFVIRREIGFAENDPFNRSMVTRAKLAIEKLGFFKVVSIDLQPGSAPDRVILLINVEEDSTGDYGATVGFATDAGILGEVSITERNFLGRGQYVRAAVGLSQSGQSFDFSFTEPRFMGLRVSAGIDVYHRIVNETASNFYGTTATGGQLRFGAPLTRDLSASVFVGAETKSFKDVNSPFSSFGTPAGPPPDPVNGPGNIDGEVKNKIWVGYGLVYNGLDDEKKPTEGLYASFSQQYVGLDYSYLKSEVRARYYHPIMEDAGIIGSVRAQAGIVNGLGGTVTPLESFHPSSTLIRGFQNRELGPRIATGEVTGTTMYAGLSGEITFPLPVIPENYGLKGAVWADAAWIDGVPDIGALTATATSTDQPLKTSVGASLIWDGPFGPLRGDVGYVITKATDDKTQIFQLTIQNLL